MKDEMIRYGIPEENIIMEDKSDSTLTNAVEVAKILKEHPEFKKVGLLTSFWHLERATVMFESQRLDLLGKMLIPLNSEDIIAAKSSRHAKIVRFMEEKPSTEKRIEAERRGIEAFKSGAYNSTPHGTNPTKED